jgi:uncharacterized protein YjhX (UPF0386 family)
MSSLWRKLFNNNADADKKKKPESRHEVFNNNADKKKNYELDSLGLFIEATGNYANDNPKELYRIFTRDGHCYGKITAEMIRRVEKHYNMVLRKSILETENGPEYRVWMDRGIFATSLTISNGYFI